MNKELMDFMMSLSDSDYDSFLKSTSMSVELDNHSTDIDYSWIDIIEKYIPFLKTAIDNPYKDIIDANDSKQLYENRFILSLVTRLNQFLSEQNKLLSDNIKKPNKGHIKLVGHTSLDGEDTEIRMELTTKKSKNVLSKKTYGLTVKERIERLLGVLSSIRKTPFIVGLDKVALVKSPIKKTDVIMENQDYKKLLEMWDFLDNYISLQKISSSKELIAKQTSNSEKDLCITYFMNYQILSKMGSIKPLDESFYQKYIEYIIESFVSESTMNEKDFKKMVNKKFEEEYNKKRNREKNISSIFEKSVDNYQKQMKDAIRALKQ